MSGDARRGHDPALRDRAEALFSRGRGHCSVARELGLPRSTVRKWQMSYRSAVMGGSVAGGSRASYGFETRVAAASAVVDGGLTRAEAMARFGVAGASSLDRWVRLYREGGAEALRPGRRGRPPGAAPMTREQELEREVRRLEAQVAYLKKSIALKAELGLLPGSGRRP